MLYQNEASWEEIKQFVDEILFQSTQKYLTDIEVEVLRGCWEGKRYEDIALEQDFSYKYIQNDIGAQLWRKLTDGLEVPVSKKNFRQTLNRERRKRNNRELITSVNNLELPHHPVPLNSPFYIERSSIESLCYEVIKQPAALIRIKSPRQMGKTSLLDRIFAQAHSYGYRTIRWNLQDVDLEKFSSLNNFLRWFCMYVTRELDLPDCVDHFWQELTIGSKISCKTYFQDYLFQQIDSPLVLVCDEVDQVFKYPDISQEFFGLLRSCHEEANNRDIWKKFRLVIAHSTENYGHLDINQSPFNVGQPIELTDFTPLQVQELAQRHQLDCYPDLVSQIMGIVGGHPYLIRLAFYHLAQSSSNTSEELNKLIRDAPTDSGIYSQHLRQHLATLRGNQKLVLAFIEVLNQTKGVQLDSIIGYQLYSMGLIKWQRNQAIPRYELYRQYFSDQLDEVKSGGGVV
jgi:hypothetical protein